MFSGASPSVFVEFFREREDYSLETEQQAEFRRPSKLRVIVWQKCLVSHWPYVIKPPFKQCITYVTGRLLACTLDGLISAPIRG